MSRTARWAAGWAMGLALFCACAKGPAPEAKKEEKPDNAATRYAETLKGDLQKAQKAADAYGAAGRVREGELQQAEGQ